MGVRDFFRRGKERSEAGQSEVGKSKKLKNNSGQSLSDVARS